MSENQTSNLSKNLRSAYFLTAIVSIIALTATFTASNADLKFEIKLAVFASVLFFYVLFVYLIYRRQKAQVKTEAVEEIFNAETEEKLLALEEAGTFFGASLKSEDMFRLVAGRINEIVPFSTCVLYFYDQSAAQMKTAHTFGLDAEKFGDLRLNTNRGLASKTFSEGAAQTDNFLTVEKAAIRADVLQNLRSAISVPLASETEIFGVMILYSDRENAFKAHQIKLLEAVGTRISPLFIGALAFERNLENALTDYTTALPNERAFYLVLENQIAEAQRFREQRLLTILTVDIKEFDELNQKFGHAVGDRILIYAAETIKGQLRQMDFLAKSKGDEFYAILPTANESVTEVIIERIEKAFDANRFETEDGTKEYIELNFGTASFLKDGETAQQLLAAALVRKKQYKSPHQSSVIWFPSQYAN